MLYESPHRLRKTLEDLLEVYGPDHPVAVARELSKLHEEIFRGSLREALEHFQEPRGSSSSSWDPRPWRPQTARPWPGG